MLEWCHLSHDWGPGSEALRRSNRLIMLVGILLAIVAFVAIIVLFSNNTPSTAQATPPTNLPTVVAAKDIPLGTTVTSDMLTTKQLAVTARAEDAFQDVSQLLAIGPIARTNIAKDAQITRSMFAATGVGTNPAALLAKGLRAMSVQIDQVSGVGTLIGVGDRVDAVVGFGGGQTCGPDLKALDTRPLPSSVPALLGEPNANQPDNTVKVLLQGLQVVGTQLPPVAPPAAGATPAPSTGTALLSGQQEIVFLAVDAQQSEVIKYAQLKGCISLILRSPKDFVDANGTAVEPSPDTTTGIVLKTLIDTYGVLPPEVVPKP